VMRTDCGGDFDGFQRLVPTRGFALSGLVLSAALGRCPPPSLTSNVRSPPFGLISFLPQALFFFGRFLSMPFYHVLSESAPGSPAFCQGGAELLHPLMFSELSQVFCTGLSTIFVTSVLSCVFPLKGATFLKG